MKAFITASMIGLLGLSIISSCGNQQEEMSILTCEDDTLFSRVCAKGIVFFIPCYDAWAIKMDEKNAAGDHLIAVSKEMPDIFRIDGLEVVFDACFHEFDLILLFPDPSFFGELFIIKDFEIMIGH